MSRYIEYHDICSAIGNQQDGTGMTYEALAHAMVEIQLAPSIDIVFCKECKHWHDHITTTWCSRGAELRPQESGWIKRNADDYCSYGEREGE